METIIEKCTHCQQPITIGESVIKGLDADKKQTLCHSKCTKQENECQDIYVGKGQSIQGIAHPVG